jgi:3-isopropylmalate dehydrogenase
MANYRIGILKGDDIGLEVVPVAVQVIKAAVKRYRSIEREEIKDEPR